MNPTKAVVGLAPKARVAEGLSSREEEGVEEGAACDRRSTSLVSCR